MARTKGSRDKKQRKRKLGFKIAGTTLGAIGLVAAARKGRGRVHIGKAKIVPSPQKALPGKNNLMIAPGKEMKLLPPAKRFKRKGVEGLRNIGPSERARMAVKISKLDPTMQAVLKMTSIQSRM